MKGSVFSWSNKRFARLLSLVLVILMFCSLVPVGALAADDMEPVTEEESAVFEEAGAASDPALAEPVQEEPVQEPEPAVEEPEAPAAEEPETPAAPEENPEDDLPPDAGETPVGDNIVPMEEGEVPEAEEPEEEPVSESTESTAADYRPPLHFEARCNGVTVIADAPEGTLPYGTGMRVAPVRDQAVLQTIGDELGADASRVTAVDISFLYEEAEIEPDGYLFVTLKSEVIEAAEDAQVVHMDNYGATQVVEQYANYAPDEVSFVADSFSVYAIVRTVIEKTVLASDGHNYRITVTCEADSGIPEDADLAVEEISGGSEQYAGYVSKTENAIGEKERVAFARFFDIKIVKDGQELQPSGAVTVRIELVDELAGNVKAVHFGNQVEMLDAVLVSAESLTDAVEFKASGFSVYGVVLTETIQADLLASDGNLYNVTVHYNDEAQIPEGSYLRVAEIERGTADYNNAYQLMFNEEPEEDAPMLAVDIAIIAPDGREIEPKSTVTVDLTVKSLPDGVNAEELQGNVTVSHLKEVNGGILVETVANGTQVWVDDKISATFSVDSFSTYTIYWYNYYTLSAQLVDSSGNSIGSNTSRNISSETSVSNLAPDVIGYTFSKATIGGVNGTEIRRIRYNNRWQYNTSASGGTWRNIGNDTVSFVYEKNPPVKVYVYVAAYDQEGNQFKNNPEFLELLGISGNTVDGNGYFPVGEITLDSSFFIGKTTEKWRALINSTSDWDAVLAALGELNTSTLIYDSYNTPTDYSLNQGNHVGEYMSQAIGDVNKGAGSQCTALFGWSGHSYGFEDQTVQYHLDLRFQTNKVTFITGNNGISSGESKDGTTVDKRAYITGSPIQQPRNLVIPAGYRLVGYYNDPNFTTPWNKIGTPITQDEIAYIKITPMDNVILYYRPVPAAGGTVSVDAEGVNPETGTPGGSTATANDGYVFVGWYADENCTQLLSTEREFVPTKGSGDWVDGTTYYAKFEEESVTLRFIAEENVDHVELVTPAGEVISVTGNNSKDMSVKVSMLSGPAVTVRGVAENGYVVKEWTIDGRTGALTTSDVINTAIADDPNATTQWTNRTYHVWAETAKWVNVYKEVHVVGTVKKEDVDLYVYFALKKKGENDFLRRENGTVWTERIQVVNGVPQQDCVTFEGLQSGTYDVWEVKDENASDLRPGDIVIRDSGGYAIIAANIHTYHGDSTSNNVTVNDENPTDELTVVNTYSHENETMNFTAKKQWFSEPNTVNQDDKADKVAPAGAWAEFGIFIKGTDEPLRTIHLDGTADAEGESPAWTAVFEAMPRVDANGQLISYEVRETDFSDTLNGNHYYAYKDTAENSGGSIKNAVLFGNINVYKQIEVQPRNAEMDALVAAAVQDHLRIRVTGPYGYNETFAFTDVSDPYNPKLQVTGLPAGEYKVEELVEGLYFEDLLTGRKWNPTLSWIKAGNGEQKAGETSVTFEVATNGQSNDAVDVRLKNDYTKYDITATKVWDDQGVQNADHPSVTFTLYRIDSAGNRTSVGSKTIGANQTGEGLTVKWEQQEQQEQQYTYEIVEDSVEGYELAGITGDMFSGFTVTNRKVATVDLKKLVTGNMGDVNKEFTFTVSAEQGGTPITIDGVTGEHTLKSGDTVSFKKVPIGATLIISEPETVKTQDGYTVSTKVVEGTGENVSPNTVTDTNDNTVVVAFTVPNKGATVTFTNNKEVTVDTGLSLDILPFILIVTLTVAGSVAMLLYYFRRRRSGEV